MDEFIFFIHTLSRKAEVRKEMDPRLSTRFSLGVENELVVVVVVSRIQGIGCQPEKTTPYFTRRSISLVVC